MLKNGIHYFPSIHHICDRVFQCDHFPLESPQPRSRDLGYLSLFKKTMIYLGFIITVFFINNTHAEDTTAVETLVVKARLLEIPGTFPPNDLYNYVYIMKYRVMKVIKGSIEDKEILVGHYNPLIPRQKIKDKMKIHVSGEVEKFQQGDKHILTLIKPIDLVWQEAIEDEYFDEESDKYYSVTTDPAP